MNDSLLNSSTRALPTIGGDPEPSSAAANGEVIVKPSRSGVCSRGSLWGTVFNVCSATLGAGVLSLPHAMAGLGLVPGTILLLVVAMATHFSIVLLVQVICATSAPSFEALSEHVFGKRTRLAVELCIIAFCFGTCIAYTIAVGDNLEPLLGLAWVKAHVPWLTRDVAMVVFWALFMLPLSFVSEMSSLQCTSLFGVLALGYLVLAVAIHFAVDCGYAPDRTIDAVRLANADKAAVSATSIVMFAFTCQVNIPSLYAEMNERTPKQMGGVSRRAVSICLVYYLVIGVCGYANFPHSRQGNILSNYCVLDPSTSSYSPHPPPVVAPAFIAITLTVLMAYPVNVFPCRASLESLLLSGRSAAATCGGTAARRTARRVGLTLTIAVGSLCMALVVPDISIVFQLMGGTAGAFTCYILPAAAAWRLRDSIPMMRPAAARLACLALLALGVLVGVLSTAVTIDQLFDKPMPRFDPCNATALSPPPPTAALPRRMIPLGRLGR